MIPLDKAIHALCGSVAGFAGAAAGPLLDTPMWITSLAGAALAGLVKEVYDEWTKDGITDSWDFLATVLGAAPVAAALGFL